MEKEMEWKERLGRSKVAKQKEFVEEYLKEEGGEWVPKWEVLVGSRA